MSSTVSISVDEAIHFVWQESALLDKLAYAAWLPLWSAAGLYIIPVERGLHDHAAALNVAYDDGAMRAARAKRLMSGFSSSAAPPARTVRIVSRFVATEDDAGLVLHAAQHLVEYKYEQTRMMAADVEFRLIREDGALKLDRKVIRLINSDDALQGIGYLL